MADTGVGPARANLSLGGNVGDVVQAFAQAIKALAAGRQTSVVLLSSVWRTSPWGVVEQPDFLNMAITVETSLPPHDLLDLCLAIETAQGRVRDLRWGPRRLDIDVITYANENIDTPRLTLPHPRATQRGFVLAPLAEIVPAATLAGYPVQDWLARLETDEESGGGFSIDQPATARLRELLAIA